MLFQFKTPCPVSNCSYKKSLPSFSVGSLQLLKGFSKVSKSLLFSRPKAEIKIPYYRHESSSSDS